MDTLVELSEMKKRVARLEAVGLGAFLGLTDTPGSYSGQSGKYAKVNSAENAIEFGSLTRAICSVRLTVDQTIPSDGIHVIEFNTEDADVGGNFSTVTHRFTAPRPWYYSMAAQIWLEGQASEELWKVMFVINNTYTNPNVMKGVGHMPLTDPGTDDSIRVFWLGKWLDAGDYLDLRVDQYAGVSQVVQGTEPYPGHKTWMSIIEL